MQALNAFKNAALGAADLIPSDLVPSLMNLHPGTRAFAQGSAVLYKWLGQQGLSSDQIMSKTPADWSYIKIHQIDKGFDVSGVLSSIRKTVVDSIPKSPSQWLETTADYFIPGGKAAMKQARAAWAKFTEENAFAETGVPLEYAAEIDVGIFDGFMRAYAQHAVGKDNYATIHNVLKSVRDRPDDAAIHGLDDAIDDTPNAPAIYLKTIRTHPGDTSDFDNTWMKQKVHRY